MTVITAPKIAGQVATQRQLDFIYRLADERGIAVDLTDLSRPAASALIDRLLAIPAPSAEPGYYVRGEQVFVVVQNRAKTRTYAKELVLTGNRARWHYAPGISTSLADVEPLSVEHAASLGRAHGVCILCGAQLTDPESVERGIGPVCAARL